MLSSLGGYAGKFLRVNLSSGKINTEPLDEDMIREYLGGNGFAIKILYDEVPPGVDPFAAENKVVFMVGPVEGTRVPGVAGRCMVGTKSPLSGYFIDSYFGGHFGPELKYAGYDGIIIEGKSEKPVYLFIEDETVELRDASDLWGLGTYEAQAKLAEKLGKPYAPMVCIGPAGENLVRFACILGGVHAAGRGGTGAVLGSKKLKAIAVRGSKGVKVADPIGAETLSDEFMNQIRIHPGLGKGLPTYGTAATVTVNNDLGMLGTRNWQSEVFEGADKITGTVLREKFAVANHACFGCPISCGIVAAVQEGSNRGIVTVGPEYETLFSFGSNCGNDNLESIIILDRLCDNLGLDSISAGVVSSFIIECFERGIISSADTDGLKLKFGDPECLIVLVKLMATRKGIGDLLAEGSKRAAEKIGGEAYKYAMQAKGLEIPAHSARGLRGMSVGYATANRGGSHQDSRPTGERIGLVDPKEIKGKGIYQMNVQRMTTLCDCLIHCRMTENLLGATSITEKHARIVKHVTGMDLSIDELITIADRVYNLERAFNVREGISRREDTLPWRLMNEPIPEGPAKGRYTDKETLDSLLDEYYKARGWDLKTGIPTESTLRRLKLDKVAEDIYGNKAGN